jgi:hypothetical protein
LGRSLPMNWRFNGDGAVQRYYILPHGLLQGGGCFDGDADFIGVSAETDRWAGC